MYIGGAGSIPLLGKSAAELELVGVASLKLTPPIPNPPRVIPLPTLTPKLPSSISILIFASYTSLVE